MEGAAGAIRLKTDRQATERLQTARTQLLQGHVAEAVRQLDQLPADTFISDGSLFVTGAWASAQVRRQLTSPQRAIFETTADPLATPAWRQFQSSLSAGELLNFCRDFGDTALGLTAWQTIAARHRDQGQWTLADTAWQRVREHPLATSPVRAAAVLGQMEAILGQGDVAKAIQLRQVHQPLLETTTVNLAGEVVLAGTVATQLLADVAPKPEASIVVTRPALVPTWTIPLRPPRDLGPHLEATLRELRDNGVWLLPASQPVLTDRRVLVRSHQALQAFDHATGEPVWQVPFEDWPWIDSNPGILENAGFRTALLEQMAKRLLADSVVNRFTTDRERVYITQDSRQSPGSPANFGAPARNGDGPAVSGERFNHLAAYRIDTGELAWKIGGAPAGPAFPLGGTYFCGPPTVVDDVLYVLGQQQTELQLLAIDARHGELLWKTTLGDLPRALQADPARQRIACPVVWWDGVLLCPTAAGALMAVDPLTHAARWAYRYGVAARLSAQPLRSENTAYLPDQWWNAWRDVTLKMEGDLAVLVSPESDRIHAVHGATGQIRWSVPREDGLLLLDVVGQMALVAEPTAIRAHNLADGGVVWRTPVGDVAGRGVVTGTHLIVPTASGGVTQLRLRDGQSEPGAGTADSPLGNLIVNHRTWLSLSTDALTAWPDLAEARVLADTRWQHDPGNAEAALTAARRALEAGDATRALERLMADHSAAARSLKKQAVKDILSRNPARWTEFREGRPLGSSSPLEQVEAAIVVSEAAAAAGDAIGAAELLLAALADAPVNGIVSFDNPRRTVRPDLALSGALATLLNQADVTQRRAIQERLKTHWDQADKGTDPFAVQRLSERWSGWEFTREKLSSSGAGPFLGLPMLAIEMRLLDAAGSKPSSVTLAALNELTRQQTQNGFVREAHDYRGALLRGDYGPSGQAAAAKWVIPPLTNPPAWPTVPPQPDSQRERNEDVYQFPVPLDVETSPFFDRLDVLVDRQGRTVRFSGGGVSGGWTVALPASQSSFRYLQHHTCGWGRGSLLILRVGFELFALAPFNDRGEPQAKVLWTLNTAGDVGVSHEKLRLDVSPAVPGVREDEYRVIDPYNRIVGQVGPVRPSYLCYAEKAKLIAIDTLTGQRRWERSDLPDGIVTGGDDDVVFVWQPQTGEMLWLQAIDGRTLATQSLLVSPDDLLLQAGRRFWYRERSASPKLYCVDAYSRESVWTRELDSGAMPFALSDHTIGVMRPQGELTLLSALTGQSQGEPLRLRGPQEIDRVVVSRDAERWYLAVSERVSQQAGLQQTQLRSGYRAPFIIGPLAAIDRDTSKLLWQTPLDREPWAADQPRAAPLLMQVYKLPATDLQSGRHSDGVVQLRDKRDGSIVFRKQHAELIGYATLTADPDRAVIDLQLERETVRLRYRPLPPPPHLPEK